MYFGLVMVNEYTCGAARDSECVILLIFFFFLRGFRMGVYRDFGGYFKRIL